jgi:hypothetical protein
MKTKAFDAVKVTREIRDKTSRKYARMTPEEEIADLRKRLPHVPWKKQELSRKRSAVKGREQKALSGPASKEGVNAVIPRSTKIR